MMQLYKTLLIAIALQEEIISAISVVKEASTSKDKVKLAQLSDIDLGGFDSEVKVVQLGSDQTENPNQAPAPAKPVVPEPAPQPAPQQQAEAPKTDKKDANEMSEIDLQNIQGLQYVGTLWFGEPSQPMSVQFDTGSASMYLITDACQSTSCDSPSLKKYQTTQSSYFQANDPDPSVRSELQYGKGFISGRVAMDRVCFSPPPNQNLCQTGMNFLSVDQGEDLEADRFSGIVGLSPLKSGGKGLEGVISQLSNSKVIQPVFSMYFAKKGQPGSKLTFGGYNVEKFAQKGLKESDVAWVDTDPENKNYWSLPITNNQVKLGQISEEDAPKPSNFTAQISSTNVLIDSGLSYALIPTKDVQAISTMIKAQSGIDCKPDQEEVKSKGSNLAFWRCEECSQDNFNKVESLVFQVGGKDLQMPKESFFKLEDDPMNVCKLTLTASDMDTSGQATVSGSFFGEGGSQNWLLGAQFMQNYYTIFDYDKKRVGLIPSKD